MAPWLVPFPFVFLLSLTCTCTRVAWSQSSAASPPGGTFSPFSSVDVSRQFDANGSLQSQSRFLFAMNRQGSIVSVDLDPSSGKVRQIIDSPKRRIVLVNPNSQTATIMPHAGLPAIPEDLCEQRFRSFAEAEVSLDRRAGDLKGVPVERMAVAFKGAIAMTVVFAPSLRCHVLSSVMTHDGVVVRTEDTEYIEVGDPDPGLFEVPATYRVTNLGLGDCSSSAGMKR